MDKTSIEKKIESNIAMENGVTLEEFVASGRTGRRNALPDIMNSQLTGVGASGLADGLGKLSCSDNTKSAAAGEISQNPASSS